MNRILIDGNINELVKIKNDEAIINLDEDINLNIKNNKINEYLFKIKKGNINVLCELEKMENVTFNFEVYDANVVFNIIGKNNKNIFINANLCDKNANFKLNNSLIAFNEEKVDINVKHNFSNTISDINNYATTYNDGGITFNVIASVPKGNKDCLVNQNSKIISNGKTNQNRINPVLLIDEYEVDAKHSAYIGSFNKNELFYLQTRGLNIKDASKLLLNGFLIGTLQVSDEEKEYLKNKYMIGGDLDEF